MRIALITLIFLLPGILSFAQDKNKIFISEDAKPTLELNPEEKEEEEEDKKKKKRKKKTFYGIKTRKGFTPPITRGRKTILETFYVIKKSLPELDPYVKEIYYYDVARKKIKTARASKIIDDPKIMRVLHGPYNRFVNKVAVETGIFYKGARHGRWELFDLDSALVDKQYYYKGWPQDSEMSYYDIERTLVKEVVPVKWGDREGDYVFFNQNGTLRITGKYANDIKVGKWRLYHANIQKRHMEVQFAENPYDYEHKPIVLREWNDKGKQVYDYRKAEEPRYFNENYLKELQAKK